MFKYRMPPFQHRLCLYQNSKGYQITQIGSLWTVIKVDDFLRKKIYYFYIAKRTRNFQPTIINHKNLHLNLQIKE